MMAVSNRQFLEQVKKQQECSHPPDKIMKVKGESFCAKCLKNLESSKGQEVN